MHFNGVSVDGARHYEVTLNFLHKINPEKVATKNTARCIEFCIAKAESGPYWTSLTTDKKKPHFLKADFNKWRDEDSDNDEGIVCFFFLRLISTPTTNFTILLQQKKVPRAVVILVICKICSPI